MAGAFDAGEFLDVEVEQFTRVGAFVTQDRRRRGKLCQAEALPTQKARDGGLGELGGASDLEARQLAPAQGEDAGDAQRVGLARPPAPSCPFRLRGGSGRTFGARGTIRQTGESLGPEAGEPLEGGADRDPETRRDRGDLVGGDRRGG